MNINAELILTIRQEKSWSQGDLAIASELNLITIQGIGSEATASLQSKKSIAPAFELDVRNLDYKEKTK